MTKVVSIKPNLISYLWAAIPIAVPRIVHNAPTLDTTSLTGYMLHRPRNTIFPLLPSVVL